MPMPDFAVNPKRLGAVLERQEAEAARKAARSLPVEPEEEPMASETLEAEEPTEEPTAPEGGVGEAQ